MVNRYQNKSTLTAFGAGIINFTGLISIDGVVLKISVSQIDPKTLEVRPSGISFYDKAKGYVFKDLYPNVSCVLNSYAIGFIGYFYFAKFMYEMVGRLSDDRKTLDIEINRTESQPLLEKFIKSKAEEKLKQIKK